MHMLQLIRKQQHKQHAPQSSGNNNSNSNHLCIKAATTNDSLAISKTSCLQNQAKRQNLHGQLLFWYGACRLIFSTVVSRDLGMDWRPRVKVKLEPMVAVDEGTDFC